MKQISKIVSNLIFWIPFISAEFLSWQMLKDRENASPAFYSFLPMTFFFVGAAFMVLIKRIRRLESRIESQEIHDSAKPRSNEDTLFDDPTSWSLAAVGTWPRFWFSSAFFVGWPFVIAYMAIHDGWRGSTIGTALFLGCFQLMVLYALRRAIGNGVRRTDVA